MNAQKDAEDVEHGDAGRVGRSEVVIMAVRVFMHRAH